MQAQEELQNVFLSSDEIKMQDVFWISTEMKMKDNEKKFQMQCIFFGFTKWPREQEEHNE